MMDAKSEVLAAKLNYESCRALTPAYAWKESPADAILLDLFERVLNPSSAADERRNEK